MEKRAEEGSWNRARSRSRSPNRDRRARDDDRRRPRTSRKVPAAQRVYVSNIPYDFRWQTVKDFFEEKIGGVKYVEMFFDERDEPRGCGIVEFSSSKDADRAVEKFNRYKLKDRNIIVQHDVDCERDEYGRLISSGKGGGGGSMQRDSQRRDDRSWQSSAYSSGGSGGGGGGGGSSDIVFTETYGLNVDYLKSLGIDCQLVPSVFAANLPYDVDEEKLRELFSLAGHVRSVSLSRDRLGKSRGFAVIEYEHPVEAVQSVSMLDNQAYYDRRLNVKIDKKLAPASDERTSTARTGALPEGLGSIGLGLGSGGMPLHLHSQGMATSQMPGPVPAPVPPAGPTAQNPLNFALAQQLLLAQLTAGFGGVPQPVPSAAASGMAGLPTALPNALSGMAPQTSGGVGSSVGGMTVRGSQNPASSMGVQDRRGAGNDMSAANGSRSAMGSVGSQDTRGYVSSSVSNMAASPQTAASVRTFSRFSDTSAERDADRNYSRRPAEETQQTVAYQTGAGNSPASLRKQYVVFRNLAESVTWEDLRSLASRFGEVDGVEVSGKGTGIVRFRNPKMAERAAALLDRTRFHQQMIEAYMY